MKASDLLAGWHEHNALMVRTLAPLGDEELSWTAGERLWSIRVLACHIVAARAWWFHSWMGEGDDQLGRLVSLDDEQLEQLGQPEKPAIAAGAICDALNKSWADVRACLERWTDADLDASFQRPRPNARGERPWRDRRYIVWHVAEHDVHHGGEISLTLGVHGRSGFDM